MIYYLIVALLLIVAEVLYFRVANHFNIVDKPNERSSHTSVVLRGGGVLFVVSLWIWSAFFGFSYPWFLLSVTLIAGVSFIDDIKSLPDSVRLVAQFVAMALLFMQLDILHIEMWWIVIIALVVCVGASNIINFMDGINGIMGAYAMASLIPLYILNRELAFVDSSLIVVVAMADVVFCFFNFRPKGKAKCFAGDVGSIGIAYILLFLIGMLIIKTWDVTFLIFLIVYGVDGCMTICHRILLHENLGEAHRKHAFQIMANELKIGHVKVSLLYMGLQLAISLVYVVLIPNNNAAHWIYLASTLGILIILYLIFMKKFYYLHEEYLESIANKYKLQYDNRRNEK